VKTILSYPTIIKSLSRSITYYKEFIWLFSVKWMTKKSYSLRYARNKKINTRISFSHCSIIYL